MSDMKDDDVSESIELNQNEGKAMPSAEQEVTLCFSFPVPLYLLQGYIRCMSIALWKYFSTVILIQLVVCRNKQLRKSMEEFYPRNHH